MVRSKRIAAVLGALSLFFAPVCFAGGPFGIDHRLKNDNDGIYNRTLQQGLQYTLLGGTLLGAVWEGGESRLGKTLWQSIDSAVITTPTTEVMKRVFSRQRPTGTDDPNRFFQGGSNHSFPSGEVAFVSAIVTPFVLEYREDHPLVYALELLPVYDAVARVKVRAHWQSDVLIGFGLGAASGYYAHSREKPFVLNVLPGGFMVGLHKSF